MDQSIVDKYSELDAQLREQFELYEQAVRSKDEDYQQTSAKIDATSDNEQMSADMSEPTISSGLTRAKCVRISCDGGDVDFESNSDDKSKPSNKTAPYGRMTMNVTIRKPESRLAKRRELQWHGSDEIMNSTPTKTDLNESGETTNDDNYESAEDVEPHPSPPPSPVLPRDSQAQYQQKSIGRIGTAGLLSSDISTGDHGNGKNNSGTDNSSTSSSSSSSKNKLVQIVNADNQQQPPTTKKHHLQLRCQRTITTTISSSSSNASTKVPARRSNLTTNSAAAAAATTTKTTTATRTKSTITTSAGSTASFSTSKQNNLTRGKHQRASISSCSSNDSYASYGSGYASGSGNSTDHEQKQLLLSVRRQQQQTNQKPSSASGSYATKQAGSELAQTPQSGNEFEQTEADSHIATATSVRRTEVRVSPGKDENPNNCVGHDDDKKRDADIKPARSGCENRESHAGEGESEEAEDDSQLREHLNELEQLTDELAKRDIFNTFDRASRADEEHYSSTIKSNSSKASSVLSTGSNISGLASSNTKASSNGEHLADNEIRLTQQQPLQGQARRQAIMNVIATPSPPPPPPPPQLSMLPHHIGVNNESRSTSTTPTTGEAIKLRLGARAQQSTQQTITSSNSSSNKNQASSNELVDSAGKRSPSKSLNQFTTKVSDADGSAISNNASTPTKQQQQDSYYHNLFQWEQLVSKGVTRPLLINDLDFTDLRDDDDCDLLNATASSATASVNIPSQGGATKNGRNQFTGEPLTISIPPPPQQTNRNDHDSVDSGTSTGSPCSRVNADGAPLAATPACVPPPPPLASWFNTVAGSRPQSQFMSSPSPQPLDTSMPAGNSNGGDQSPANSMYSSYSRNSVCVNQNASMGAQFNGLQGKGNLRAASSMSSLLFGNNGKHGNKRKKTMKLFWKEVREDKSLLSKLTKKKTIWDEIKPVPVDTQKLEYLFESKAKDLSLSKSRNGLDGSNQRKLKITVLDAKRSNAINIGMTKLPPMRTIKNAILKMDSSIMNREGIEKILTTMMPTDEEKSRIIEAQLANPETPLGTAEQFLLNLASISALEARLKLWAFQLDYAQIEKEVAEPLMDLKQAIEEIEGSETFRIILGTLLSIGNFLNSTNVKGFQIDYLEKVPEVKDTVHKHSLLHHLCLFIQEKYPELDSDLYSEFSAVNRASKVDYAEVAKNLKKMQLDCKASWDHLKIVAKHDGLANLMNTTGISSSPSSSSSCDNSLSQQHMPKSSGKLNNLSKLSMITTVIGTDSSCDRDQNQSGVKQLKIKVSDFLTDCAERIMVLMVVHRRVMNRFQKLLVYLGCPSSQIKQTQPQQILKIINEFALEYRTKRGRVREMLMRVQKCHLHGPQRAKRWQTGRWAGSQQCLDSMNYSRPYSTTSSCASPFNSESIACPDCAYNSRRANNESTFSLHHHANNNLSQSNSRGGNDNRCGSPSGASQVSNYSDYLFDQSYCDSRRESVTPVPSDRFMNSVGANRRAHSMSASMFDLQNQQQNCRDISNSSMRGTGMNDSINELDQIVESEISERQKDEQLRRLLGVDKSFYGACRDLYQMKHWSSTMTRVTRPESQAKIATIRRMSGQQLERRESDEHGHHPFPA